MHRTSTVVRNAILLAAVAVGCLAIVACPDPTAAGPDHYWTEYNTGGIAGTDKPLPRGSHSMALADGSSVVLFGGYLAGELGDTWEYDASAHIWTQQATGGTPGTDKPTARYYFAMAYAGGSVAVLFGGYDDTPAVFGDTWEYDASTHTWTQQASGGTPGTDKPEARTAAAMAYAGGSTLVLFGGVDLAVGFGDTWEYDASTHTWSEYSTGGTAGVDKPVARYYHAMAYAGGTKVLLFGGDAPGRVGDTWVYDASNHTWTQYNTTGTAGTDKPTARRMSAAAFAGDGRVILFGGFDDATGDLEDTWEYNVSTHVWRQFNVGGTPGTDVPEARYSHAMADAGGSRLILVGGTQGAGETWEYQR